jgi:hypothetical protein
VNVAGGGQDTLFDAGDVAGSFIEPAAATRSGKQVALRNLAKLRALRKIVDQLTREQVAIARTNTTGNLYWSDAVTWPEIGLALGVSKQAVAAKYGRDPAVKAD